MVRGGVDQILEDCQTLLESLEDSSGLPACGFQVITVMERRENGWAFQGRLQSGRKGPKT